MTQHTLEKKKPLQVFQGFSEKKNQLYKVPFKKSCSWTFDTSIP